MNISVRHNNIHAKNTVWLFYFEDRRRWSFRRPRVTFCNTHYAFPIRQKWANKDAHFYFTFIWIVYFWIETHEGLIMSYTVPTAVVIRVRCDRDNLTSTDDLWNTVTERPFLRSVISRSRFNFYRKVIRVDNYRCRAQRQLEDKLAAFREVWNSFVQNLTKYYILQSVLTVDEQLIGVEYPGGLTCLRSQKSVV